MATGASSEFAHRASNHAYHQPLFLAAAALNFCLNPAQGLALLEREDVDLVIQDMNFQADTTSGAEGVALFQAIRDAATPLWGPVPVAPYMSAGATDSLFLRAAGLPVYVFNGIPYDVDDDRSHGQDERIGAAAFDQSLEFTHRLLGGL